MYDQTSRQSGEQIRIEDYAPLVKRIAYHLMLRMPASVLVEDLIQAGMIGLIEASQKFDASKGASFETYAGIRIRGAIMDETRKGDWVPRSVHRNARKITQAIGELEARLGREAGEKEIAEALEMTLEEYRAILQDTTSARLFSYEESATDDDAGPTKPATIGLEAPTDAFERDALKQSLARAITQLPEREQLVLSLYYDEELNLKEIGQVLGVSESRVSQIHSQAAARLKAKLSGWTSAGE
ncbi:RNA polymerase sigma factor FliA [Simiduia sp. 21SJ11W-1]|nr:RNA polymerase sigma factor FliA [Simiduia sp. 21SJ11W-1]UTA49503.1 RNA polymerase sigma factor FliA [Simiduia sp. 21SJ11W-1]